MSPAVSSIFSRRGHLGRYLLINIGALAAGVAIAAIARAAKMWDRRATGVVTIAIGLLFAAIAGFGAPVAGASRWMSIAGLSLQPSLILLPAAMVAFAAHRDALSSLGLAIAGIALGAQPDRAMSGALVSGLGVLWIARRRRGEPSATVAAALIAAIAGFVAACLREDVVPPVPYVEQVVQSSFAFHPLTGLAVIAGLVTMLVPAAIGGRQRDSSLVFGAVWLAIAVAAIAGNYPTPLVGYSSSAILGYCLSASALSSDS